MGLREQLRTFFREGQGVGTIEPMLVLVVLIGLMIIFRKRIITFLENIFKEVNSQPKEVY